MKKRLAIAVVLALVMLVTLSSPVLADREAKQLFPVDEEPGTGKAAVQTTHDNYVKVTVRIKEARINCTYDVYLEYTNSNELEYKIGEFTTNKRGSGRFSIITGREFFDPWQSGSDVYFKVRLKIDTDRKFNTGDMGLHFK